jgi:hypothetical protein
MMAQQPATAAPDGLILDPGEALERAYSLFAGVLDRLAT